MGIRARSNHWHYRFKVQGKAYEGSTGLAATKRNENAAKAIEARRRLEVQQGKCQKVRGVPFPVAAQEFLDWCQHTEYREHPHTAQRHAGSFSSLTLFFGHQTVSDITIASKG